MIVCCATASPLGTDAEAALCRPLLAIVPRAVLEPRGVVWCDAAGLDVDEVADSALAAVRDHASVAARAGVARTPITAEVAARTGGLDVNRVAHGEDAVFLAKLPLDVLAPDPSLLDMLVGSGIELCGELAALDHESVEVRFGSLGSALWRMARADDRRRIFPPMKRRSPEASLAWVDYVIADPERLLFVINSLVGSVCEQMDARAVGAREMTLIFSLASRSTHEHRLRPARPSASREKWMRLIRAELERLRLPDAVSGMTLRVDALDGGSSRQGDLFDRGFATAGAAEDAVARLLDDGGASVVEPKLSSHHLVERRAEWVSVDPSSAVETRPAAAAATAEIATLSLQLLPEPRRIVVETVERRDHEIPVRYRDTDGWEEIASAAGPERVSGGEWERAFAREYFRCASASGRLLWIYKDSRSRWFLHGWWD